MPGVGCRAGREGREPLPDQLDVAARSCSAAAERIAELLAYPVVVDARNLWDAEA
jgi:hypothetical protein